MKPECKQENCDNIAQTIGMCNSCAKKHRLRRKERGEWKGGNRVSATPVVLHLQQLRAAGLGMRRLAELTGITSQTIRVMHRQDTVFANTAAKILAVPVPEVPHRVAADSALVDAAGTHRRLQGLVATGYPQAYLSFHLGIGANCVNRILSEGRVMASTARSVEAMFNELAMKPGNSDRARRLSAARNWVPPLAWDEEDIDNPNATPYVAPKVKPPSVIEMYDELVDLGWNPNNLAAISLKIGYPVESIERAIHRRRHADRETTIQLSGATA